MNNFLSSLVFLCLVSAAAAAKDQTTEAAAGGGIGGAIGGAIGAEIDGRNGAIIGAGVGAAIGAAVATEEDNASTGHEHDSHVDRQDIHTDIRVKRSAATGHPKGYHCPPGQAKKGRC